MEGGDVALEELSVRRTATHNRLRKGEHVRNPVKRDPLPDPERTWQSLSFRCKKD